MGIRSLPVSKLSLAPRRSRPTPYGWNEGQSLILDMLCLCSPCDACLAVRHLEDTIAQVFRQEESNKCHRYLIIVHVKADHIFSKYFKMASQADLALFRGMFMTLDVRGDLAKRAELPVITNCEVHQAFLPKFENESQDSEISSAIQAASGQRYMMATVKHSGSLATLSHDLIGAKNSQGNIYTAVAVLLLKAHYQRVARSTYVTSCAIKMQTVLDRTSDLMHTADLLLCPSQNQLYGHQFPAGRWTQSP